MRLAINDLGEVLIFLIYLTGVEFLKAIFADVTFKPAIVCLFVVSYKGQVLGLMIKTAIEVVSVGYLIERPALARLFILVSHHGDDWRGCTLFYEV